MTMALNPHILSHCCFRKTHLLVLLWTSVIKGNKCISWWGTVEPFAGCSLWMQGTDLGALDWPGRWKSFCVTVSLNRVFLILRFPLARYSVFSPIYCLGGGANGTVTASLFSVACQTVLPLTLSAVNVKTWPLFVAGSLQTGRSGGSEKCGPEIIWNLPNTVWRS